MVYIFGGSFMNGGERLGALGFLNSPELKAAGALNLGLQDQV